MNEVLVMAQETSRHECWEDAIARVATLTARERAGLWLRSVGEGVFVFDTRLRDETPPVAWITDPVQYRRAASSGELEDILSFSEAGPGEPPRPGTNPQPRQP